jgi:hypothetical protein
MEDQDRTCHSCAFNTWWKSQIHDCKCSGSNLSQLCLGFKTEDISLSYKLSFQALLNTGRMNIFEFKKFKVLIDFAQRIWLQGY